MKRQVECTQAGVVSGGWHERPVYSKGVLLGKPESHRRRGVWGRRVESAKPPSGSTTDGKIDPRFEIFPEPARCWGGMTELVRYWSGRCDSESKRSAGF